MIFWVLLLSVAVIASGGAGPSRWPDMIFFAERMSPILNLYGTVCLAYEFLTAIRNESNKNRLNQELIKACEYRDAAEATIPNKNDRRKRVEGLKVLVEQLRVDLDHEMKHVRRKFYIGWFGLLLIVISSFLQIFSVQSS